MSDGGISFGLSVDRELGVLLRVVNIVDDLDAEFTEFTHITVDEPLPDALYAPLPHAQVRP